MKHPEAIFIQLTTRCNARCINCPHHFTYGREGSHPSGQMSDDVWQKILNDMREMDYRGQVGLYLHHEPFLATSLVDKIKQVNEHTKAYVVISTNGALLDCRRREELITASPRLVHVNINSPDKKQYQDMTGLSFEQVIENTRSLIAEAKGRVHVEINCPVLPGVDTGKLKRLFPGTTVNVDYWGNSRGGLLPGISAQGCGSRFKLERFCIQPIQNFNILHDGGVIVCCMDWMHESKENFPNIMDSSISEIYESRMMNELANEFQKGRYTRYRMCRPCAEEMGFHIQSGKKHVSRAKKLRVLLSNHHLLDMTGSELFTYVLADFLQQNGHEVTVYSNYIDRTRRFFDLRNIYLTDNLEKIQHKEFDVAHVHHNINAMEARYYFPTLPIIFLSHGVLPFLEQPPHMDIHISHYLAVSEEVRDNLARKGVKEDSTTIFRNIVDPSLFRPLHKIHNEPRKALVLSNRIDGKSENIIRDACSRLNIDCTFVGTRFGQIDYSLVPLYINRADIVFTLGRGVIETMMCGRIPVVFDYLGGDGMVTPENILELMKCNFSGRTHKINYSTHSLIQELLKYKKENGDVLREIACQYFSAETTIKDLIDIYHKAISRNIHPLEQLERRRLKYFVHSLLETRAYMENLALRRNIRSIDMVAKNISSSQYPNGFPKDRDEENRDFRSAVPSSCARSLLPSANDQRDISKKSIDTNSGRMVSIIIPVFNKLEYTKKCLEHIINNTPEHVYEVVIVDNASSDGTHEFLARLEGDVKIITNEKNLGFAKACNQGARAASGEYLVFLNNDTEVQPGWIEPMVAILDRDPSVAAVSCKMLFPDRTIQHAGVIIINDKKLPDPLVARHIYYGYPSDHLEANQARTYQALTAACLLLRRAAFEEVEGFDEEYWNGYEDVDLCFKLQQKGWLLAYQPRSEIIHHEYKSGPERFRCVDHNIERLHGKWLEIIEPDLIIESDGSTHQTRAGKISSYSPPGNHPDLNTLTSIIILTFNQLDYTKKCLDSVEINTPEPHELILVDNGSTDGTVPYLLEYAKNRNNVRLILNEKNLGFAGGNNQGIEAAKGDDILFLNNDVVVTKGWLGRMKAYLKLYPDVGMIGPMSNSVSGEQRVGGTTYGEDLEKMHEFAEAFRMEHEGEIHHMLRLVGFCLLIRKEVLEVIGGLDENYVSGNFEDDDLCLRSYIAGYKNIIAGDVFIHHYGSMTFKGNAIDYTATMKTNLSYFEEKWKDIVEINNTGYRIHLTKEHQVQELIHWGEEKYLSGDLESAVKIFERVLKLDRRNSRALSNLGVIQWEFGKAVSAIDIFQKALILDPKDPDALANLVQAVCELNRHDLIENDLVDLLRQFQPASPDLKRLIEFHGPTGMHS